MIKDDKLNSLTVYPLQKTTFMCEGGFLHRIISTKESKLTVFEEHISV